MEIRVAKHVSDDEHRELFGWGEDIFVSNHLNLRWKPKDLHIFVDVDGRPVTHVGLLEHTVEVGEQAVRVCGVGGVVTVIHAHGKGYATHAMRHAATLMRREMEVDFGFLFCRDQLLSFYERLGWRKVEEEVLIDQPDGPRQSPMNVMVLPCRACAWPKGRVKLNSFPW